MTAFIQCEGLWAPANADAPPTYTSYRYDPTIEPFDHLGSWRLVRDANFPHMFVLATNRAGIDRVVGYVSSKGAETTDEETALMRRLIADLLLRAASTAPHLGVIFHLEGTRPADARVVAYDPREIAEA